MIIKHKASISSRFIGVALRIRYWVTRQSLLVRELNRKEKQRYTPGVPFVTSTIGNLEVSSLFQKNSTKHLLFFHGGAYVFGGNALHYNWLEEFHTKSQINCHIIEYPLAPEYTVDITLKQVVQTMKKLIKKHQISELYIAGDSAGGGLAIAIDNYVTDPSIKGYYFITPWLDLTLSNKDIKEYKKHHSIIDVETLKRCGKLYTDNQLDHPDATVSKKDVSQFPPITIYSGDYDPLYPQAVAFVKQNPTITHHVFHKAVHDFALLPYTREFAFVIDDIVKDMNK